MYVAHTVFLLDNDVYKENRAEKRRLESLICSIFFESRKWSDFQHGGEKEIRSLRKEMGETTIYMFTSHSFIYSDLLSSYYVPGTQGTEINKMDRKQHLPSRSSHSSGWRQMKNILIWVWISSWMFSFTKEALFIKCLKKMLSLLSNKILLVR